MGKYVADNNIQGDVIECGVSAAGSFASIKVIITEESYASKCSALDLEPIQKHETYVGKRKKRGLFVTKDGLLIN